MEPLWTDKHHKIIEEYERRKKEGTLKEFVIIPRTINISSLPL